jgi:hypothetical protein
MCGEWTASADGRVGWPQVNFSPLRSRHRGRSPPLPRSPGRGTMPPLSPRRTVPGPGTVDSRTDHLRFCQIPQQGPAHVLVPPSHCGGPPWSTSARVMTRPVPHRRASRHPACDGQVPPRRSRRMRHSGWSAMAALPRHQDQARSPLVPVGALFRVAPPARPPHAHGTIRTPV